VNVDIAVPTCKRRSEVDPLLQEIRRTRETAGRTVATCQPVSAAINRNLALEQCGADLVIMCDDDITNFPAGWDRLLAAPFADEAVEMTSARLMAPNGEYGQMLGHPNRGAAEGLTPVPSQELPTACICIRNRGLQFDEGFVGSGWEDTDYSARLRSLYPEGNWLVVEAVRVVHLNEQKHQHAGNTFERNKALYMSQWGRPR
jgi:hypothetical protein